MKLFFGSRDSILYRYIEKLGGLNRPGILWVDFSSSQTEKVWSDRFSPFQTFPSDFKTIRALIPPPSQEAINWVFVYETVCFFKETCDQAELDFGYLNFSGDKGADEEQIILFIQSTLKTKEPRHRIFRYQGTAVWWSPQSIRKEFFCKVAGRCLKKARELENDESGHITEEMVPWRTKFKDAFDLEFKRLTNDFTEQFSNARFSVDTDSFIRRFGYGRSDNFERLINAIMPERNVEALRSQDREGHEDTSFLFHPAINPFSALRERMILLERLAPLFYAFPASGINDIQKIELDQGPAKGQPHIQESDLRSKLGTPLWTGSPDISNMVQEMGSLRHSFQELADIRNRNTRRTRRRELETALGHFLQTIQIFVNGEEDTLLARPGAELLRCLPNLFFLAYRTFWDQFVQPFIVELVPAVWSGRRFIFQLPAFVPAPFFRSSLITTYIIEILIEAVRLLNLYQFLYVSLTQYRSTITESQRRLTTIKKRLPLFREQIKNIKIELALAQQETFKGISWINDPEMLLAAPEGKTDRRRLVKSALNEAASIIETRADRIGEMASLSREPGGAVLDQEPNRFWIPAYFQVNEAWAVSKNMIQGIVQDKDFQQLLPISEGENRYYYMDRSERIADPSREPEWSVWKRCALQKTDEPLRKDIQTFSHVHGMEHENLVHILIGRGFEKDFWELTKEDKGGDLTIAMDAYAWSDFVIRRTFFQHKTGLTRTVFEKKCDRFQLRAIVSWLKWFQAQSRKSGTLRPSDMMNPDKGEIFESILDMVMNRTPHPYFGRPHINPPYFMLEDCMDPALMRLFMAENKNTAMARHFSRKHLFNLLVKDMGLTESLASVFFSFSVFKGDDLLDLMNPD